jgi:hypothetical protein
MKTTFYVYKIGDTYLKISTNKKKTGGMFVTTFVKDINKATYWQNKMTAKSWTPEKQYPKIKLVPCGLSEIKTKK